MTSAEIATKLETLAEEAKVHALRYDRIGQDVVAGKFQSDEGVLRQAAGRLRKLEEIAKAAEPFAVDRFANVAQFSEAVTTLRAALSSLKEGD